MTTSSICFRLNVLFALIVSCLLLMFGAINYFKIKGEHEASMERQAQSALARMSASLPNSVSNFDKGRSTRTWLIEAAMLAGEAVYIGYSANSNVPYKPDFIDKMTATLNEIKKTGAMTMAG